MPTAQDKVFQKRIEEIQKRQDKLLSFVQNTMQRALIRAIYEEVVDKLDVQDGTVKDTQKNLRLLASIDRLFNTFDRTYGGALAGRMTDDLFMIGTLNEKFYSLYNLTSKKRFDEIRRAVNGRMREGLGISRAGSIDKGGYLDRLINDQKLREEIKKMTYDAVRQQTPLNDFRKGLGTMIEGSENVDGYLARYYRGFAYDKYQEFDRSNNKEFAKHLDLVAFRYAGGLIEESRDFCRERNNKVFTVEEAQSWKDDPDLPRSKAERESGSLVGYDPIQHMGRYNCRHTPQYITRERAEQLRPELKAYFESKE